MPSTVMSGINLAKLCIAVAGVNFSNIHDRRRRGRDCCFWNCCDSCRGRHWWL